MAKNNKIKVEKYHSEDQTEVIRFIKILVILIILVVGVYFLTRIFVTKDLFNKEKETTQTEAGVYNENKTLIGNMFHKTEKEYYVLLYSAEDIEAVYYGELITVYQKNKDALKVYFADLSNELNKKYTTKNEAEINLNTTDFDKLKVGKLGLIKVSDGKIVKALTDEEKIAKELEYKKEK